jgi:hypothetical protein
MTLLFFLEDFSSKFKVRIDEAVPPRCSLTRVHNPRRNLYIPIRGQDILTHIEYTINSEKLQVPAEIVSGSAFS